MAGNVQKRRMQAVGGILKKKLSHPRFSEALKFGVIKRSAEHFFREKGLAANILEFDYKTKANTLVIRTAHPSMSRELLGYQEELNMFFKEKNLPTINRMRIITGFSR